MTSCQPNQTRVHASKLWPTAEALDTLKKLEGLRLRAYGDVGGKRTIGYGHLMAAGEPSTITKEQAERLFATDVRRHVKALQKLAPVPFWQSEFDALLLFIFNIGEDHFRHSTIRRKLLALDYAQASHEFDRWVHVKGKVVKGLQKRRAVEKRLFNTVPF